MAAYYIIDQKHQLHTYAGPNIGRAKEMWNEANVVLVDVILEAKQCPHNKLHPPGVPDWMEFTVKSAPEMCKICGKEHEVKLIKQQPPKNFTHNTFYNEPGASKYKPKYARQH